jgi:hypothetical protein
MSKVIVYQRIDGGVSVVVPSPWHLLRVNRRRLAANQQALAQWQRDTQAIEDAHARAVRQAELTGETPPPAPAMPPRPADRPMLSADDQIAALQAAVVPIGAPSAIIDSAELPLREMRDQWRLVDGRVVAS